MEQSKSFYKTLMLIAFPIMLQNLLSTSLSLVDTLMIGQLGANQIAAVGIANQIFFLINLFIFGIASGASIFFAQYYGAKKYEELEKITALALSISLIASILFTIVSLIAPNYIVYLFTTQTDVVEISSQYQRWVAISYIFFAISFTHGIAFRSIGKGNIPLIATFISLGLNAIGNYLLIFGIGPFPELGADGAAIATTFSRFIEMVILLAVTYIKKEDFRIRKLTAFKWNKSFIKIYFVTCFPVLLNEMLWSLGMTAYKIGYSRLGVDTLACINVSEAIANFFFVFVMGLGNATTIFLGQILGQGDVNRAKLGARKTLQIALFIGTIMGLFIALSASSFTSLFKVSEEIKQMATRCLYVKAIFQPLCSLNMVLFVGILRSGGDTRYSLIAETSCVWFIGVTMAFLGAEFLKLPIYIVVAMTSLEEIAKIIAVYPRYKSGKWVKSLAKH